MTHCRSERQACRGSLSTALCRGAVLLLALAAARSAAGDQHAGPRVIGQPVRIARQLARLADCELVVGRLYIAPGQWRDELLPDVVVMQTPQPRTPLGPERVIAAWTVRRARPDQPTIEMPDLRAAAVDEARRRLESLGLRVMHGRLTEDVPAVVDDHYPRAGQRTFVGGTVFLSVVAGGQE